MRIRSKAVQKHGRRVYLFRRLFLLAAASAFGGRERGERWKGRGWRWSRRSKSRLSVAPSAGLPLTAVSSAPVSHPPPSSRKSLILLPSHYYCCSAAIQLCDESIEGMKIEYVDIAPLPFLNTDLEVDGKFPVPVEAFRRRIRGADAFLFASPEYNYSFTGNLPTLYPVWLLCRSPSPIRMCSLGCDSYAWTLVNYVNSSWIDCLMPLWRACHWTWFNFLCRTQLSPW